MIFKLKMHKTILFSIKICIVGIIIVSFMIPSALILDYWINKDVESLSYVTNVFLFFSIPFVLVTSFLELCSTLEWYIVYEDKIEVRYILGKKNEVYFKDVIYIKEFKIRLLTFSMEAVPFYMFVVPNKKKDGCIDECLNKNNRCVRLYKSKELEEFIKNNHNHIMKIDIEPFR